MPERAIRSTKWKEPPIGRPVTMNETSTTVWQPQRDSNPCRHLERVVS
jgi:hypothetical protein